MKFKNLFKSVKIKGKKKRLTVLEVINWIWLGVLIFLIINSLIYQAPWKVNFVLVIFLLGCTVLPSKYRKWFWAGVGFVFVFLILWVLLPNGKGWEPYRYEFTKEVQAINSRYQVSDEKSAATIFNSIMEDCTLEDLVPYKIHPDIYQLTQQNIWTGNEYPGLLQWLKGKENVISRYIEASNKDKCYFPVKNEDVSIFMSPEREHLRFLSQITGLVLSSACNDLGEDRIQEGLEKQISVLRISEFLKAQPIDYDVLASISIQGLALNSIQTYVIEHEPSDNYLETVEAELSGIGYDWAQSWEKMANFEQLKKMNYIHWFLYEQNPNGKVRIKIQNYIFLGSFIPSKELPYWPRRIAKAQNIIVWFFIPSNPDKIKDIVGESIKDYALMEEFISSRGTMKRVPSFAREELNLGCFVNMHMNSSVWYIYELFSHLKTELKASRIMIALRRYKNKHGYWPRRLEEISMFVGEDVLVDLSNGGEYTYKVKDEGFVLYSKGLNRSDDKGYNYLRDPGKEGCDDWRIWPPR
ncbi:MAG: hypothetical protein ACYSUK_02335 [Planctomycetota bacterium]|jgi:hypothetical protein